MGNNRLLKKFNSEVELAKVLEQWLQQNGWEVFKEFHLRFVGHDYGSVDIVAKKGDELWCIETKLNYGVKVLEQAYNRLPYFKKVSVATPTTGTRESDVYQVFRKETGVGRIQVSSETYIWDCTDNIVKTKGNYGHIIYNSDIMCVNNTLYKHGIQEKIIEKLHPLNKNVDAGGYDKVTAFGITIENIRKFLKENPNSDMKTIVKNIDHHYQSDNTARNSLNKAFNTFLKNKDIKFKKESNKYIYYLEEK